MFKKVLGFILCAVILASMTAIPAVAMFDLGEYNQIEAEGAMNGWMNEADEFEAIIEAKYLYLEFTNPVDTLHVIVFGDGNGWGWPDTVLDVYGTSLLIDLEDPDQAPDWADVKEGTQVKILITLDYTTNLDEVGLKAAYLLKDGESAPAGAVVAEVSESAPAAAWVAPNYTIGAGTTVIKAIDFDSGVYFESNAADGNHDCRPDEEVQTEFGESGFGGNIGWTAGGEWVQYTVTVEAAGSYGFNAWLASDASPTGNVEIYVDDVLIGASSPSLKRGWQAYDLFPVAAVDLTAGTHIIKALFPSGGMNISAIEVNSGGVLAPEPDAAKPAPKPEPAPTPTTPAPKVGDSGVMIIVLVIALAGAFVVTKRVSRNKA